ncbi:hypothetical protein, partial [Vibrio parahaemolyticus]|uniref:hypothetical protein n=1 Tax=Vibrio parahaemolyticus TaxID=670 RepID=UPI0021131061
MLTPNDAVLFQNCFLTPNTIKLKARNGVFAVVCSRHTTHMRQVSERTRYPNREFVKRNFFN